MAIGWSYDSTKLDVPLNAVRFLIGDTVADDPLIEQDDEISFCLSQKNNDIYLAGAFACNRAAAKLVRELSAVGKTGLVLDVEKEVEFFNKKAKELEEEAVKQSGVTLFFGGISKSDIDAREDDTDAAPSFKADSHMMFPANANEETSDFIFGER